MAMGDVNAVAIGQASHIGFGGGPRVVRAAALLAEPSFQGSSQPRGCHRRFGCRGEGRSGSGLRPFRLPQPSNRG